MRGEFTKIYFEDPRSPDFDLAGLGRALFDLREFAKCTQRLSTRESQVQPNSIASFLLQATVLIASEERTEAVRLEGSAGKSGEPDKDMQRLERHLQSQGGESMDGFHWYLLGVVLKRQKKRGPAR